MAFTLPLIAALLGRSLISQVPLQVQPYRGGSEEESTPEEVLPEAEDDNDWLSGPSEEPEESALELTSARIDAENAPSIFCAPNGTTNTPQIKLH